MQHSTQRSNTTTRAARRCGTKHLTPCELRRKLNAKRPAARAERRAARMAVCAIVRGVSDADEADVYQSSYGLTEWDVT